jgi:cysteinyl-tRNA synthetase
MDDDLNVPQALAALHDTVRTGNTALAAGDDDVAREAMASVLTMTRVLGLDAAQRPVAVDMLERDALSVLVEARLEERAAARANKDWAASDAIRDSLATAGIMVEDGPDGASWSLKRE